MLIPYIVLRFFGIDVNTEKEKPKEVVKVNVEKNNLKKFKKYKESPNYDKEKTEEIVKPNIIEVRGAFQSSESSERDSSKDLTKPSPIKCIPFSKNTSFTIDLEMILEKEKMHPQY